MKTKMYVPSGKGWAFLKMGVQMSFEQVWHDRMMWSIGDNSGGKRSFRWGLSVFLITHCGRRFPDHKQDCYQKRQSLRMLSVVRVEHRQWIRRVKRTFQEKTD